MVTFESFRKLALSFPEATEEPHFEKTSFRVKKKIFATFDKAKNLVSVKLTEIDQSVFTAYDKSIIFPVDNKWGKQGWTLVSLDLIHPDMCTDLITTAYCTVAPKTLSEQVRPSIN